MTNPTRQVVLFEGLLSRPAHVYFDEPSQSSDGGLPLLAALDRGLGLTERLTRHLADDRQAGKVVHSRLDLFRQRVFSLAAGYADCNDAERIGTDPVLKEACGRDAVGDPDLGSQPTLSRFENSVDARTLVAMGRDLEDQVIERHRKRLHGRARRIVIDLDPTDDPTHGQQAFSFFNGHYDTWCFLPLLGFLSFDDEPDQYLFLARLRPGKATPRRGALRTLRRVVAKLRGAFPKSEIVVRLDGGFSAPETYEVLEALGVKYAVGMGKNKKLVRLAEPAMQRARSKHAETGRVARHYSSFRYAAGSWGKKERRVVVKAEITLHPSRAFKENPRFVVTNLRDRADLLYEFYGRRGEAENRIKELNNDLELGRTSCTSFLANQLRVLMTASAYVLYQELRLRAAGTCFARCQVGRLRERLIKIGARLVLSVRRIVMHFPSAYPWQDAWKRIAVAVGAAPV